MPRDTKGRPRRRGSFGYIVEKGPKLFAIRWREGSRSKQKSGFETRTEAAEALARIRVGLGDGTLIEKRRASIGFDEVAKEWLRLRSAPKLRSHQDNVERYELHLKPFFGNSPLSAITPTRILELRAKLQAKTYMRKRLGPDGELREVALKYSNGTINLVLALARSILRFAVVNGHMPTSPTDRIGRGELMFQKERAKMAPPIESLEAAGRLLVALRELGEERHRPSIFPMMATLLYTGIRRGEAAGLRWSDVDLDRRMLMVRRSYGGMTKSAKHRAVPIPVELATILRAHKLADPWKGELVFPNDDGTMFTPDACLGRVLSAALARAGLPRVRVHDLRHGFASFFVMGGGDIFTVQKILGHSTPQLVSDTYGHLSPTHLVNASDRISFPAPPEHAKVIPIGKRADSARAPSGDTPDEPAEVTNSLTAAAGSGEGT